MYNKIFYKKNIFVEIIPSINASIPFHILKQNGEVASHYLNKVYYIYICEKIKSNCLLKT